MGSDLCLKTEDGILNIRVGAIIMKGNKFLMAGNDRFDHLYSVGEESILAKLLRKLWCGKCMRKPV